MSLQSALAELSSSLSSCKFEASDSSGDEVVILKIMTIIQDAMSGSIGTVLGDIEICEMLETVLTTSCQMRLSGEYVWLMRVPHTSYIATEILRRSAEGTLHQLVKIAFTRLNDLDPVVEERKLADGGEVENGEVKMSVNAAEPQSSEQELQSSAGQPVDREGPGHVAPDASAEGPLPETPGVPRPPCGYISVLFRTCSTNCWVIDGLPAILELLRVLINILDPNDQAHTDSTRLTALRTLNVAFEVAGTRICTYPSLSALVLDHGCKYLFQLARSDHPVVLQTSLRTIATMFETMRPKLKLQQELFLAFTIDRLAPPSPPAPKNVALAQKAVSNSSRSGTPVPSTPLIGPPSETDADKPPATPRLIVAPARGDTRELLLETLCQISRHPSFMVDLYVNYDCDMNCENMFERLADFAAKVLHSTLL